MKTDEILKLINDNQYKGEVWGWDELEFIPKETYKNLVELKAVTTNPRRDYVGTKTYIKNKFDGEIFYIEIYGNDMAHEIYSFGKAKEVEKTIVTYEDL